jgi:hypothetical protein
MVEGFDCVVGDFDCVAGAFDCVACALDCVVGDADWAPAGRQRQIPMKMKRKQTKLNLRI